jgi:diguanylate cyclase (GGDEF)-like protein
MSLRALTGPRAAAVMDYVVFALGTVVAGVSAVVWYVHPATPTATAIAVLVLIVVMSRFPLVLPHRSGDVVIGFETCALVFLVLTVPAGEAVALWSIGMAISHGTERKSWRTRMFNIGLTIMGGALLVAVTTSLQPASDSGGGELGAVMVGCAVYFLFDIGMTAASLALEARTSVLSVVQWQSVPLGLASFLSVDTLGFLAAILARTQSAWTMLLLLVPIGTMLVAVSSISRSRLAERRLSGLLEAAIEAPDWSDDEQIEQALVLKAERTLRQSIAELRHEQPEPPEIGSVIEVNGRARSHLVVRRSVSAHHFDDDDRRALDALTAIGVAALNRRRLAEDMAYLARHDVLTGLCNRAVFGDRLDHALARRRSGVLVAVLYCDLDGFKGVNDLLGHEAGDRVLAAAAERILGCLRAEDTAARLGGDEFGILLDGVRDEAQADRVAQRILEALVPSFHVAGRDLRIQVSIGIAFAGDDPVTGEVLVRSADTAMYRAKALGKGRAERFMPEMRSEDLSRLELEVELRAAIDGGEIDVDFQPVIDLVTGQVAGFEALARWHHRWLGPVEPDVFIPVAERLGLIRTLGMQVLERAHRDARTMVKRAGRPLVLGINLSAAQITDPAVVERVRELRDSHPDVNVVLELTESALFSDDELTIEALQRLRRAGTQIAIDDFGVGYSSISYLQRLPVDIIKIDKSFARRLDEPRTYALVQGIIAMATAMGLSIVTEGLDSWGKALTVRDLGCRLGQGFLFAKPLAAATAGELFERGSVDISPLDGTSLLTTTSSAAAED